MENDNETKPEPSGNPGDWYLELLGVEPAPPGPATAAPSRSQSMDTTFILDRPSASASIATPLELPAKAPLEPALELSTEVDATDLIDWAPGGPAKQTVSKRSLRWPIVITLVVLVAIVIAAVVWLPTTVEAEAREEAADYGVVLDAMRATLPDIQQTLATATEPSTTAIELLPLSGRLSILNDAAAEVVTRAARPLPETLPLLSRSPLENLVPTRDRMAVLGADGADIAVRISETISYRALLDGILVFPSLPIRADANQISGLSLSLAEALEASSAVLAGLSLEPAFDAHRLQVAAAVESFGAWQTEYLDALRRDDQAVAGQLIDEVARLRADVFSTIVPALANIRSEVDAAILRLNTASTEAITAIPS